VIPDKLRFDYAERKEMVVNKYELVSAARKEVTYDQQKLFYAD
jgi:hypothetical protein